MWRSRGTLGSAVFAPPSECRDILRMIWELRCGPYDPEAQVSCLEFHHPEAETGRFFLEHVLQRPEVKVIQLTADGHSLAWAGQDHGRVDVAH